MVSRIACTALEDFALRLRRRRHVDHMLGGLASGVTSRIGAENRIMGCDLESHLR